MSSADLASWKEAFSLFDKRGNGQINRHTLGDLLRAIGQNPTQAEVAELESNAKNDINFDEFVKIAKRPDGFRPAGEPEELIKGFQIFDKENSGYIGVGELRYGERMSDEDVDELLKGFDSIDGRINYTDFVKMILSN